MEVWNKRGTVPASRYGRPQSNNQNKRLHLADAAAPDRSPDLDHGVVNLLVGQPRVVASLTQETETYANESREETENRKQAPATRWRENEIERLACGYQPSRRQFRGGRASCCRGTSRRTNCTEGAHHAHGHVTGPADLKIRDNNYQRIDAAD